jgi:tRNA(Ile)-lysidine synthase
MADDPFLQQVEEVIRKQSLLADGSTVLLAVSGGADSVCLLDVLVQLAPLHRWQLHVGHFNHRLRGEAAEADAVFVQGLASRWGLPCTVEAGDVADLARAHHLSLEDAARRLRYAFLTRTAQAVGAAAIALAHHQDDQAETVLLHLLRGSGLAGLAGMQYRNGLLVRPLLDFPRQALRDYCQRKGLAFREDATNLSVVPQRNWVRHVVIPMLQERYPQVGEALARAARVLGQDFAFLVHSARAWLAQHSRQCDEGLLLELAAWRELHPALQAWTLRCAVQQVAGTWHDLEQVHLAEVCALLQAAQPGMWRPLPGGLMVRLEQDGIWMGPADRVRPWQPVLLAVPGETSLPSLGQRIVAEVVEGNALPAQVPSHEAWLDLDQTGTVLRVRPRQPGDRFLPLGMATEKKLQDFFVDTHVPLRLRDRIPLVETADGCIVWVAGHRLDARFRVTAQTCRMLHLRLETSSSPETPPVLLPTQV